MRLKDSDIDVADMSAVGGNRRCRNHRQWTCRENDKKLKKNQNKKYKRWKKPRRWTCHQSQKFWMLHIGSVKIDIRENCTQLHPVHSDLEQHTLTSEGVQANTRLKNNGSLPSCQLQRIQDYGGLKHVPFCTCGWKVIWKLRFLIVASASPESLNLNQPRW